MRAFLLSMLFLLGLANVSSAQVTNCSGWLTRDSTWTQLAVGDDNSSSAITLPFNFCWYGTNLTSVYVNNNGNISFGTPYGTFSASGFPNGSFVMLAPFWADVDTRGSGSGHVYYKVFPNYMAVQWDGVGYYGSHFDKLNYFQIVISDGTSPLTPSGNVAYSYKDMQWTTGDASSGSGGFGGVPAVVGANKGDGINYFQLGAFNNNTSVYNGTTTPSGVNWLDNQQFVFNACPPNTGNLPPILSGIARCDTLRLCVGDTLPVNLNGFGPEASQTVTFTVSAPGVTGYTVVSNTAGTAASLQSYFVGSTANIGLNTIHVVATDNDTTSPASTVMDIKVLVQPLPSISAQPISRVKCENDSTAFAVTATGVSVGYQWQINRGSGYVNLSDSSIYSGTATSRLTLSSVDTTLNGYTYRVVVKNSSGCFVNSSAATLTINKRPSITSSPRDTTICEDGNAAFAITAYGTNITYQWQVSSGGAYSNVTNNTVYGGATTATLSLTAAPSALNGNKYRCIVSGTCNPADTSAFATLHENMKPRFTVQPLPDTICNGSAAWFAVVATGTNVTYQWQVNTGSGFVNAAGAQYTGTTADTLKIIPATLAMQGYQYRCIISGTCAPSVTSNPAGLRVDSLPGINTQAQAMTVCDGDNASFSIAAAGTNITYQWQVNTGSGFTALSNNSQYAGATTNTLSVTGATASMNGYLYRCLVSGKCAPVVKGDSVLLTVNPRPVPAFTANNNSQCLSGNSFTFTNTTTIASGSVASYRWNFGDGATSTVAGGIHTYTAAGTYTVKLVAFSVSGCKDSVTHTVTVYPQPTAAFNTSNTAQCLTGNSFTFNNTSSVSSGTITNAWDFGDGTTGTTASPVHTYAAAGTYTVKLVVTTGFSCKDSMSTTVTVFSKPTATFTANTANQCYSGNNYVFTNTSAISGGTLSYSWNFGDGSTSTATNGTHSYTAAGTYIVKLVATSNSGCADSSTQTIVVYPQPVAGFNTANASQCFSGNSFTFNNTSAVSSGTLTYAWNFGDGGTSTATSPAHSYTAAGTYTVKLVTTTGFGCKDSMTLPVTVFPKPAPSFTVNTPGQCLYNNSYSFTNTSTLSVGTLHYTWRFGDGATDTAANPSHAYTTAGVYIVKLIAASSNGCADSTTQTVTVYPQPVASFNTANNAQCVNGNSYTFANTSSVSSGTMTYAWNFGDGFTDTAKNPVHVYTAAGTYTVKLVVKTASGCKDSATGTMTIYPKPAPAFTVNTTAQCFNTNSYSFTNASTITAGTLTYRWNFGDGNSDTASNPVHVYTAAGTYTVTLAAKSNNGCTDSVTKTVTIFPAPVPAFAVNNQGQCVNINSFSFGNGSAISSGTMTYMWTFGDGGTSTSASPVHVYAAAGSYTVKLVVTSDHGCKDSITQSVTVYPKPAPAYTVNNSSQCLTGNSYVFTNTGTISSGSMTHSWDFGDGTTSTQASPTHSYTTAGTYIVLLTSSSNFGCTDTVSHVIVVKPMPAPPVTVPVTYCQYATTVALTATGTANLWYTAATGGTGSASAPVPSSATPGNTTWYVTQTVNGCESIRAAISDTVFAAPVSTAVAAGPVSFCNGDSVRLNANLGTGLSYQWNYNGTPISAASDNNYIARISGAYTVTVTGDHHCTLTSAPVINVTVHPLPDAYITYTTPISFCQDGAVVLTGATSPGYTYQWYKDGAAMTGEVNYYYIAASQGSYSLQVTSQYGCVQMSALPVQVTVFAKPVPVITKNGFDLSTGQFVTYQWFLNGQAITNAVQQHYHATQDGGYYVEVSDNNGCVQRSSVIFVNNVGIAITNMNGKDISVYPNPTNGIVNIEAPAKVNYFITSVEGKLLQTGKDVHRIDISGYPDGMYMLNITDEENHLVKTEKLFKSGN